MCLLRINKTFLFFSPRSNFSHIFFLKATFFALNIKHFKVGRFCVFNKVYSKALCGSLLNNAIPYFFKYPMQTGFSVCVSLTVIPFARQTPLLLNKQSALQPMLIVFRFLKGAFFCSFLNIFFE